jgi:hypothetical protein
MYIYILSELVKKYGCTNQRSILCCSSANCYSWHFTFNSSFKRIGVNLNFGIFFTVSGIAQLSWVVPIIRRWGLGWYNVGIGGTIVLIVLFVITRMPDNPITGRGGPISPMAIAIEVLQAAFIGLTAVIIVYEIKGNKQLSGRIEK